MTTYPIIHLKPGREEPLLSGHPWVFSGAVERAAEEAAHGGLVAVHARGGRMLGVGTHSRAGSITARIFDRRDIAIDRQWFAHTLRQAERRRAMMGFGQGAPTTGYRVLFGEADGAPGLVVDRYAQTIVFTLSTAGLDALRAEIIAALDEVFAPSAIVERSDVSSRKEEGLADVTTVHKGEAEDCVEFMENGVKFLADPLHGQKTGFFLDQKDLRRAIPAVSGGRTAVNLFSYTGASGVMAIAGGAASVHNVDGSARALSVAERNAQLAGAQGRFTIEKADVFQWLGARREPEYDMVIMDPPSIIKSRKDEKPGRKAYHFLNRAAIRLVKDGGIFITSSCSQFLSREDFSSILAQAAFQAGATLYSIGAFRQAADHPAPPWFPEGEYLKSHIFQARRW